MSLLAVITGGHGVTFAAVGVVVAIIVVAMIVVLATAHVFHLAAFFYCARSDLEELMLIHGWHVGHKMLMESD